MGSAEEELVSTDSRASSTNAATAAACGAAAEVPKNVANPGAVVETPSGADSSGFCLSSEIS